MIGWILVASHGSRLAAQKAKSMRVFLYFDTVALCVIIIIIIIINEND